jgi:hypothetical protein
VLCKQLVSRTVSIHQNNTTTTTPLASLRAPSPIKQFQKDVRVWEILSPYVTLLDTHPGVPPIIFHPYVLFCLYNPDFIDLFEKQATVLTVGVIQMRSDCQRNCASTPGSRITPCAHPHLPRFVHRLYIPGFGWGLWELGSDMPWGGDWAHPTGPPPSDDTIVGISHHHSPPLAFRWVHRTPSSHQYLLGGCLLVGNPLPSAIPPLG